jgi:cation transport regulator
VPYKSINELPESVRNVLPEHALNVYKEAFNSAYDEYAKPSERHGSADREETAHKVAWAAVKKAGYEKSEGGGWLKK